MIKYIWIMGNLASGKSTLCESLIKDLKAFPRFDVDIYRRKINKRNTMKGEGKARDKFMTDLYNQESCLLESIGTYGEDLLSLKDPSEYLIIRLEVNSRAAERRLRKRVRNKKDQVPFPYIKKTTLKSYMNSWKHFNPRIKYNYSNLKIDYSLDTSYLTPEQVLSRVRKFLIRKDIIK